MSPFLQLEVYFPPHLHQFDHQSVWYTLLLTFIDCSFGLWVVMQHYSDTIHYI